MNKKNIAISLLLFASLTLSGCSAGTANSSSADTVIGIKTTQAFKADKVPSADIDKILQAGVNSPSSMNTQPWHFTAVTDEETTNTLAEAMSSMKPPAGFKPEGMPTDGERPTPPNGEDAPKFNDGERPEPPSGENAPDFNNGEKPEKPTEGNAPDGKKPNFAMSKAGIGDAPLTIVISCEEGQELSAGLAIQNMSAAAQLLGYGTKILTSPTMALNGDRQAEFKTLLNIPENQKAVAVLIVGVPETEEKTADGVTSATTREDFNTVVTKIGE